MRKVSSLVFLSLIILALACRRDDHKDDSAIDNPEIQLKIPLDFPSLNKWVATNKPTRYGVALGKMLFHEKKLSGNNTISCATCHKQANAFADHRPQAIGIYGRIGFRNTAPIQNLAFMKFYNWDGNIRQLEKQPLVPIITHAEMNSSIVEAMDKIRGESHYKTLFKKAYGDTTITPERIYKSIAQYEYTLISANSKYDKVKRNEGEAFTINEARGFQIFKEKCASCHNGALFTDQSFRNIGFPLNPTTEEAGRARVTGSAGDYMRFRVPSLRNIAYTAPYGSFGQFTSLQSVLDYLDKGVLSSDNLDPILKEAGNKIPMTTQEKTAIISFLHTLSDPEFVGKP